MERSSLASGTPRVGSRGTELLGRTFVEHPLSAGPDIQAEPRSRALGAGGYGSEMARAAGAPESSVAVGVIAGPPSGRSGHFLGVQAG